jgi:hypothetical protein
MCLRPTLSTAFTPTLSAQVKLLAEGRSCHSGYPHLGDSAVSKLLRVLHDIEHVAQWPEDQLVGYKALITLIIQIQQWPEDQLVGFKPCVCCFLVS